MQTRAMRVVHYLNQFFGHRQSSGWGPGEERPVGPGRASERAGRTEVVATVICGDNYFAGSRWRNREVISC
jgi:hypothetical protein